MKNAMLVVSRLLVVLLLTVPVLSRNAFAQWIPLGPDGGDVRSLTYDPRNPDRIFLGTSAGQLYLSTNGGANWARFAQFGADSGYVLDHVEIDPQSGTLYVAAWSVANIGGDLFRSRDGGRTWQTMPAVHGKSIRAMTLAPSDPKTVLIGALDGVFRSRDGGETFERISPPNHAEIKNIESLAVDPRDPNVIYAGTFHLAWKTTDGGRNWHPIRQGVVDDSDVFSIIVDYQNPQNVYLSACSGIYKSENAAELFHKIQGIPFSARRTRVLKQDPTNPTVVYAGTTEGLWKTVDAGTTWRRITDASVVVNDVHVDPRKSDRVLLATDRSGVLATSSDAGQSFRASNRGFVHRQVSTVIAERNHPQTIYAGLLNDKEFGGVFVSRNGGEHWEQLNAGLGKLDVFTLRQTANGELLAGTNHGIFLLTPERSSWQPANTLVRERAFPAAVARGKSKNAPSAHVQWIKSELTGRISQLEVTPKKWFAAGSTGLFQSIDNGKSWRGGAILGHENFLGVQSNGELVIATTGNAAIISRDAGETWTAAQIPAYVTGLGGCAVGPDSVLWLATSEGALRSTDSGQTWEHVLGGLPTRHLALITYDGEGRRLLAVTANGDLFASRDAGKSWHWQQTGFAVRSLTSAHGRLLGASLFDGVVAEPEPMRAQTGVEHGWDSAAANRQ